MAIRILMVSDAEGSYSAPSERFGLTELVQALKDGGYQVTKAHRWNDGMQHTAGADITSFKFQQGFFNANDYDVVWLMGFASSNPQGPYGDPSGFAMSDSEVEVLAQFMNDGGGVFATGDHDDLGADLCAKVPRVRSMRQWTTDYGWLNYTGNPDAFVPDASKSPPPVGRYRLDTLVTGHNVHYEFQDQSDDIPQQIDPVMRVIRQHISHIAGGEIGWIERVPHPLLCGPNGVIDVLPDHMHEGRCLVPQDLTKTFAIKGQSHDEYPLLSNGTRVSPEVVAYGRVKARSYDPNFDDPTEGVRDSNTNVTATNFPVITAYNGHRAKVGRVVVDSTFHHFTNINVTGVKSEFSDEPNPVDAVKGQGFLASPAGQAHYANIKAYWCNIAKWLSRPKTFKQLAWQAFLDVALDPRLKQTALNDAADRLSPRYLVRHGAVAWDLMTQKTSPCMVLDFVFDVAIPDPLSYLLSPSVYIKLTLPDPPPNEVIRKDLAVDKLELAYYALGGAMIKLRQPENRQLLMSNKLDAESGMQLIQSGAMSGLRRGLNEQSMRMERTLRALKRAIELSGKVGKHAQTETPSKEIESVT
ncbi:MAG: hypothetical protein HY272_09260 [Gammaproteobacteria bacterium]|nr:hypothetical protein [Gammaproteobacteria bacterium]